MNSKRTVRLFKVITRSLFEGSSLSYSRTVDAIIGLGQSVHEQEEIDYSLGECGAADIASLLVGAFWFFADYHGGQFSPEYKALSVLGETYDPGFASGPQNDSSESEVYSALEEKFNDK